LKSNTEQTDAGAATDCDGCPLVDRREFVRSAGVMALGVLAALGLKPAVGEAMPFLGYTSPLAGSGRHRDTAGRSVADQEKAYPIPATDGAQIDKDNETIIARAAGKVYVFSLGCPHQNTGLHWNAGDHEFQCPKHHSRFLPDGNYIDGSGRATRGMDRFAVRKDANTIVANLDALLQQDQDDAWTSAFITV
jgi:arsenite oxidase small subunit